MHLKAYNHMISTVKRSNKKREGGSGIITVTSQCLVDEPWRGPTKNIKSLR